MRLTAPFLLLAMLVVFSNASCPDLCEDSFFANVSLTATIENRATEYSTGETVWISADFPANQSDGFQDLTINENGGLVVLHVFELSSDSTTLLPPGDAVTFIEDQGQLLERNAGDDPAAVVLRFSCPNGRCGFRQGVRLDRSGIYLLVVNGSTFELEAQDSNLCSPPVFSFTELSGGNNLSEAGLNSSLNYPEARSFFIERISTSQDNIFLLRAE